MSHITTDTKSKTVSITLNSSFYPVEAVKSAVKDFKDVCDAEITGNKKMIVSLQVKEDENLDEIGYEFCNYVLGLMKNEGLV